MARAQASVVSKDRRRVAAAVASRRASQVLVLLDRDSEAVPRSQDHLSHDDHLVALVDRRDAKVTVAGVDDDRCPSLRRLMH